MAWEGMQRMPQKSTALEKKKKMGESEEKK